VRGSADGLLRLPADECVLTHKLYVESLNFEKGQLAPNGLPYVWQDSTVISSTLLCHPQVRPA